MIYDMPVQLFYNSIINQLYTDIIIFIATSNTGKFVNYLP